MYESFFGLTGLPFKITPDDRVFYGGAQRQDMLDALVYTLERGEGLVTVIGEVGTGKTTLARALSKRLPDSVRLASIYMPNVQPLDMLYMIAQELGLDIPSQQPKYVVLERLRDYLLKQQSDGGRSTLLLIDEAQTMSLETLEELRLLSNMQSDDFKLLQIMLFGQQELEQILNLPSVRQVKDRIVYELKLKPFSIEELSEYLEFRMRTVGYRGGEAFFSPDVVLAIHENTKGFARAVNKLADQVLMSAFAQQSKTITRSHVSAPVSAMSIQFRPKVPNLIRQLQTLAQLIKEKLLILKDRVQTYRLRLDQFNVYKKNLLQLAHRFTHKQILAAALVMVSVVIASFLIGSEPNQESVVRSSSLALPEPIASYNVAPPDQSTAGVESVRAESSLVVSESIVTPVVANTTKEMKETVRSPVAQSDYAALAAKMASPTEGMAHPVSRLTLADWQNNHEATLQALSSFAKNDLYSIQLMSDPWRLRDDFNVISSDLTHKLPTMKTFMTDYVLADGRPRIALLYGVYNTMLDAQSALNALPSFAKKHSPVVVSLKRAYMQMQQSNALQMEP